MAQYYSKGGANDSSYLRFETPANWNTEADGSGSDATDLTGAHLILQANDFMDLGANVSIGSVTTLGDSHLKGHTSYTITCTAEGDGSEGTNGYAINLDGTLDGDNLLNLAISGSFDTNVDLLTQTTHYPRNFSLNMADGNTVTNQADMVLRGIFYMDRGTFLQGAHAITIENRLLVGTGASGTRVFNAGSGALTIGSGDVDASQPSLYVYKYGTFTGGSGDHIISNIEQPSFSDSSLTLTSGATTINGENQGNNRCIHIGETATFNHGGGAVKFSGQTTTIKRDNGTLALNDVALVSSANITETGIVSGRHLYTADGTTYTGGAFAASWTGTHAANGVMNWTNSTSVTCTGIYVDGSNAVYTCTDDVHTVTKEVEDINYAGISKDYNQAYLVRVVNSGTFNHNDGTFVCGDAGGVTNRVVNSADFHNLNINQSVAVCGIRVKGTCQVAANKFMNLDGNTCEINAASNSNTRGHLIVEGSVNTSRIGNWSTNSYWKTIKVLDGGTYNASTGTTYLTGETDTGGTDFMLYVYASDDFTHNGGTVYFDDADLSSGSNVRCPATLGNVKIDLGSHSLTSHHNMTAVGSFQVITGAFSDGSNGFNIDSLVTVKNTAELNLSNSTTQTKNLGALLVESGGAFRACRNITEFDGSGAGHSGQPSAIEVESGATFNNNLGTCKFTSAGDQDIEMDGTGTFYNLELAKSNNDAIMHANVIIENNLTVDLAADHTLRPASTTNTITVRGTTFIKEGKIGATTAYDGTNNWGNLVMKSGTFILGSGTNNVTSIRNKGGTIS